MKIMAIILQYIRTLLGL